MNQANNSKPFMQGILRSEMTSAGCGSAPPGLFVPSLVDANCLKILTRAEERVALSPQILEIGREAKRRGSGKRDLLDALLEVPGDEAERLRPRSRV